MKKTRTPREWIRIVNIVFLILILLFIGNTLFGLINDRKTLDCLWTDGLLFLIFLNSWVLALRPFYDKLERMEHKRR